MCAHSPYASATTERAGRLHWPMMAQPVARMIDAVAGKNVAIQQSCQEHREKLNRLSGFLTQLIYGTDRRTE
jgi:hypothetical protein